jgi:hypothetical protein
MQTIVSRMSRLNRKVLYGEPVAGGAPGMGGEEGVTHPCPGRGRQEADVGDQTIVSAELREGG